MMLIAMIPQFYKVKRGQTVKSIAEAFSLPECAVIGFNDLKKEVWEGQILHIPRTARQPVHRPRGRLQRTAFGQQGEFRAQESHFASLSRHEGAPLKKGIGAKKRAQKSRPQRKIY